MGLNWTIVSKQQVRQWRRRRRRQWQQKKKICTFVFMVCAETNEQHSVLCHLWCICVFSFASFFPIRRVEMMMRAEYTKYTLSREPFTQLTRFINTYMKCVLYKLFWCSLLLRSSFCRISKQECSLFFDFSLNCFEVWLCFSFAISSEHSLKRPRKSFFV